jgi:dihydroorotate dehydrogenase
MISDTVQSDNGGFSGKVVENLTNQLISDMYKLTNGSKTIIGCGGIFDGEDAYKKIKLGASLLEMITGLIFEGPQVVGKINRELVQLLKADGYKNIAEAVGSDIK